MTKRRYNEDLPEDPPRRGGPGPFAMAVALMFGAGMALTADSHADPRSAYAQVAKSITIAIAGVLSTAGRFGIVASASVSSWLGQSPMRSDA